MLVVFPWDFKKVWTSSILIEYKSSNWVKGVLIFFLVIICVKHSILYASSFADYASAKSRIHPLLSARGQGLDLAIVTCFRRMYRKLHLRMMIPTDCNLLFLMVLLLCKRELGKVPLPHLHFNNNVLRHSRLRSLAAFIVFSDRMLMLMIY